MSDSHDMTTGADTDHGQVTLERRSAKSIDPLSRMLGAFWGMWIGDALAMPAHYYRDRNMITRHYDLLNEYKAPNDTHPGSRMTKQTYNPFSGKADVVHDMKEAWMTPGTHVHKSLSPGENTLNLKLAKELMKSMRDQQRFDCEDYTQRYLNMMLTPGAHGDTWVDEAHRSFFNHCAQGKPLEGCGDEDSTLAGVCIALPLLIRGWREPHKASVQADELTDVAHKGKKVSVTVKFLANIFSWIFKGQDLDTILYQKAGKGAHPCLNYPLKQWIGSEDFDVIGHRVHPGDHIEENMPTLMYLALKYERNPGQALLINAHAGGDSCHRGAILGALLGAINGVESLPADWVFGLRDYTQLDELSDWLIEI